MKSVLKVVLIVVLIFLALPFLVYIFAFLMESIDWYFKTVFDLIGVHRR